MSNTVICIGRQYGSGGREIGEALARRLGVPCYDKLLVKKAAEYTGLSEEILKANEEIPVKNRLFSSGNIFADSAVINHVFYSESQLAYDAERTAIQTLAGHGPCVIVGRCASAILREQGCLSVFVYADDTDRLGRVMRRNSLDERTARQRIKRIDRMRRQYFDFYCDTQWGQPESYDLMLSSSRCGIEGSVETILRGLKSVEEAASHE